MHRVRSPNKADRSGWTIDVFLSEVPAKVAVDLVFTILQNVTILITFTAPILEQLKSI